MNEQNKTWTLKEMVEWMTKANGNMFQHKFSNFCTFFDDVSTQGVDT